MLGWVHVEDALSGKHQSSKYEVKPFNLLWHRCQSILIKAYKNKLYWSKVTLYNYLATRRLSGKSYQATLQLS